MVSQTSTVYINVSSFLIPYKLVTLQLIRFHSTHIQFHNMDLEWLLPQQIEQILRLCDLSSIHDPSLAASILQQNHWDLEIALNELVGQNDHHTEKRQQLPLPTALPKPQQPQQKFEQFHEEFHEDEDDFELTPEQYHQLDNPTATPLPNKHHHSAILAQQNKEYQEMERSYIARLAEDQEQKQYQDMREKEFQLEKAEFSVQEVIANPMTLKFRLHNRTDTRAFRPSDPVDRVFKYVSSHLRSDFEHRYCEFDLTQAFPPLSLKQRKADTLQTVFGDSTGEVLIVREQEE